MNSAINYILSLSRASKSKIILVNDFLIAFKPIFNAILNDVATKKAFFLYEKKMGVI